MGAESPIPLENGRQVIQMRRELVYWHRRVIFWCEESGIVGILMGGVIPVIGRRGYIMGLVVSSFTVIRSLGSMLLGVGDGGPKLEVS